MLILSFESTQNLGHQNEHARDDPYLPQTHPSAAMALTSEHRVNRTDSRRVVFSRAHPAGGNCNYPASAEGASKIATQKPSCTGVLA